MHDHASTIRAFGDAVRERRKHLGLTQAEVAELADVAVRTVHAVEAGKATIRLDALLAVLDAVGLQLSADRRSAGSAP